MPGNAAQNPFFIRLLGSVTAEGTVDGKLPALPRKGWALLSYLAAHPNTALARDRLAEIFWPDLPIDAARNNLRQVLLPLQRTLKDDRTENRSLLADRHSIRLAPQGHHRVDLIDFLSDAPECVRGTDPAQCAFCINRMEAMADLYRGEFMAGFDLPDCPEFDDWLLVQRESLLRRALVLFERLSNCHEELGNAARALSFAQRYADLEPWNEDGQRRLMRLLALNGQRSAALSQYDACRRFLKQDLGVQPEEETRNLAKRIQAGDLQPPAPTRRIGLDMSPLPPMNRERRQVTVLYCQLSPTDADDPDEVLDLLRDPQARCVGIIETHFGHVVRTNDGGLLAYFGYPEAREHAARSAVRAGLSLVRESSPALDIRVGIHTGLIITSGDPALPDPIGKTSNRAIRLRELADGNGVAVSGTTHALVAGFFDWEPPIPDDAEAFIAVSESGAKTRLGAAETLTPLIGRDAELAALSELWAETRGGERRALLLTGDPGIGKSRLVDALKRQIAGTPCVVRELFCFPEDSQTPFQPLIGLLQQLMGITPEDDPAVRLRKLTTYAEETYPADERDEIVRLLAGMMSLPREGTEPPPSASPRTHRDRIMQVFLDQVLSLAARQPLLLVVEDLHWIDPTTLELLTRELADSRPAPILILLTARPEFVSPWPESRVPVRRLEPLGNAEVGDIIGSLGIDIPAEMTRHIVEQSDGIPLFAEELARAVPLTDATRGDAIPATLHDLLAARLDGMSEAKGTAQLAAAIGRDFPLSLLRELSPLDDTALDAAVARLREAGILAEADGPDLKFRHALFQDTAYQSQTKPDRRAAHGRIARALQARFPEIARNRPETLARHWAAAGEPEAAIGYWIGAGRLNNLRGAYAEAVGHFTAALDLIGDLPDKQRRIQFEFDLQVGLGAAYFAVEGYGSPKGADAYARAVDLGERHQGDPDLFPALWGLWPCLSSRTNYDDALALTLRVLDEGVRSGDPIKKQQGHFAVGNIRFWRGEFTDARDHLDRAIALYEPGHHERLIADFGENAFVTSASYLSWTLCLLGEPDGARAARHRALEEGRRIDHPFSLGYALTFATVLSRMLRDPAETQAFSEETVALAEEHGLPLWKVGASHIGGWALVRRGRSEGLDRMRESLASIPDLMSGIKLIFLETQIDALCHLRRFDEALAVIAEAREVVDTLGDRHVEAELHRLEGLCLLEERDREDEAEACFRNALLVSQRQQARLLELRAAVSLAELHRKQGRPDAALARLRAVRERFTEGGDIHDLRKADRLLAEMADDG